MAYKVKVEAPCMECGEMTNRRLNVSKEPCCLSCALERAEACARMMSAKRGFMYQRWVTGMNKALSRQAPATPPSQSL